MVTAEYKFRRDPLPISRDVFLVGLWLAASCRAASVGLRHGILRVKNHLPPANVSGLEDMLGRGGEVLAEGTSLVLAAATNLWIEVAG